MFGNLFVIGFVVVGGEITRGAKELPLFNRIDDPLFFEPGEHLKEGVGGLAHEQSGMAHGGGKDVLKLGEALVHGGQSLKPFGVFLLGFQEWCGQRPGKPLLRGMKVVGAALDGVEQLGKVGALSLEDGLGHRSSTPWSLASR